MDEILLNFDWCSGLYMVITFKLYSVKLFRLNTQVQKV